MRFLKEARNFVIIKMLSQDLIKHNKNSKDKKLLKQCICLWVGLKRIYFQSFFKRVGFIKKIYIYIYIYNRILIFMYSQKKNENKRKKKTYYV